MKKEDIESYIAAMPKYVPVRLIERKLNMPKTTLQKVLKGQRELPKKWVKPLEAFFKVKEENIQEEKKKPEKQTAQAPARQSTYNRFNIKNGIK